MSQIATVDAASFEQEVLQAKGSVLVDFWAPWCPPCRALTPLLEEVARDQGENLKIVKCDVDENVELSQSYGVGKIPHLLFFQDGEPVNQAIGYISRAQLHQCLTEVLGEGKTEAKESGS